MIVAWLVTTSLRDFSMLRRCVLILAVWFCAPALVSLHAEPPAKVASLLQPFVDKHELAGAVAVVVDREKVLAVETVGYADIAGKKALEPNAMFWIASQTKPITATGVLMLVDEGKIKLDDPIEKYLPEFRGQMVVAEKD